ncbi:alpha-amylase family glycosyl hydrolase [Robertkochia aurantiaca]|uniref:alpha-amylase family glycosyl hydrolase n=1 Tax=Robertkochia aurantiaca TaxID=2873700 RepID=UPI001CCCF858|nr:alpha-amylase family glycosyl hydrolase [Robertkochia sp. 3YJGBD-33]
MRYLLLLLAGMTVFFGCKSEKKQDQMASKEIGSLEEPPFEWKAANIYFLLTDRFNNGNPENDVNFDRTEETGVLRDFKGGDIKGITEKIKDGYFTELGVNAIWFTPVVEQIHGVVDEGTGNTYAYHGYWAKDWTTLDPNFGTREELAELVEEAHKRGIRVLLDVVINHTGPVTAKDPAWDEDWVRLDPTCTYQDYESTVSCTLVDNLPDIKTESDGPVDLPMPLLKKWQEEGRYDQEIEELDRFFAVNGYPMAPRFYIIKWLTDYVRELGVDGFRVDTAKHTEAYVWQELYREASIAFQEWKTNNPDKVLDDKGFYMVGEVYNYGISTGRMFSYGDKEVDFYDHGFESLINFDFKHDATRGYDTLFTKYDSLLQKELYDKSVLNYLSSHDDGSPFDRKRKKTYETATKLLLSPGASQIYYGDELARPLQVEGAVGDANLRSFMNWEDLEKEETRALLEHWQKLGQFRKNHPAIGAGKHTTLKKQPFVFSRTYETDTYADAVIVVLMAKKAVKTIDVSSVFSDGTLVKDAYSGITAEVTDGEVRMETPFEILLLEKSL